MFELTAENALDYLRQHDVITSAAAQAEVLSGGVSNQVLRVTTSDGRFVVKQSRPQLRTRAAWFSDLERIYREQEVMQALHPHLPAVVPEVIYVDRANYIYAMSHAPLEAAVWKAELLGGRIERGIAEQAGAVLGRVHQISAEQPERFEAFRDHQVYVQLRVDPFYRRVQERRPEVAHVLASIIDDMLTIKEALCHGDYTPKNMLVHAGALTLVDYETAHVGDPTMDLGLFGAHLFLKALHSPAHRDRFRELTDRFWKGYCQSASYRPHRELEKRGLRHLGACLLARVDGTSPIDYLPEESQRETVRRLAREILLGGIDRWEDAWQEMGSIGSSGSVISSDKLKPGRQERTDWV
jgi:aminoglycoside phosphotransferase (APT) family kinase protein